LLITASIGTTLTLVLAGAVVFTTPFGTHGYVAQALAGEVALAGIQALAGTQALVGTVVLAGAEDLAGTTALAGEDLAGAALGEPEMPTGPDTMTAIFTELMTLALAETECTLV
jgi:hypothetical protein